MEAHTTVDATLDAYERFARVSDGRIGVCLQADLERTADDLERLASVPGKLRLVKGGAYERPPGVAYTDADRIDRAYRELLERAFESVEGTVAVATHDPAMIEYAIDRAGDAEADLEFQLLMGVRPQAQRELATEYDVWQFLPYGTRWKRWALNWAKRNAGFAARAVAGNVLSFTGTSGTDAARTGVVATDGAGSDSGSGLESSRE